MAKMFDIKDLETVRGRLKQADKQRELVIKKSRDIIKLSKEAISLVHQDELNKAATPVKKMESELKLLQKYADKDPRLKYSGSFKAAEQEFVEAKGFFEIMKNGKLPVHTKFRVNEEHFVLGVCDLPGELVRKAINAVINEDYATAKKIHNLVTDIYNELTKFDFFSGELRKKYDSIKYDLRRLEDLMLGLKLQGKI